MQTEQSSLDDAEEEKKEEGKEVKDEEKVEKIVEGKEKVEKIVEYKEKVEDEDEDVLHVFVLRLLREQMKERMLGGAVGIFDFIIFSLEEIKRRRR